MIGRFRTCIVFVLCIMLSCALASCKSQEAPQGSTQEIEKETASSTALHVGEVTFSSTALHAVTVDQYCISGTADGCYAIADGAVWYIDEATGGQGRVLCQQFGCRHKDATCNAWIGEASLFCEYDGCIYAVLRNSSDETELVELNLLTGDRRTVLTLGDENTAWLVSAMTLYSDKAVLYTEQTVWERTETSLAVKEYITSMLCVDLITEEVVKLFPNENVENFFLCNIYEDRALIMYTDPESNASLLTQSEFVNEYGEQASYGRYYMRNIHAELRLYDLKTYEYVPLTSDGLVVPTDGNAVSGALTAYLVGDCVHIYDIVSNEDSLVYTSGDILNYWILDKKLFCIRQEGTYYELGHPLYFEYIDLETGDITSFDHENDGVMTFSLEGETANCFWGLIGGERKWISKEDFYADRYTKVYG